MRIAALLPIPLAAALWAGPALAQDDDEEFSLPQVYTDMVACREIADDAQRLACYDRQVAALQQAEADESIVVVDREEVRQAERGLFGLRLPSIRLFGGSDESRVNEIESTIAAVDGSRSVGWRFRLADESVWIQTDMSDQLSRSPRAGMPIIIRRAALGSFRAEVDGMRLIRVRRVE